ncbi:hypothetical protein MPSEU_000752500 [Mayamaea pseudoterrestris]|nr:hypothetical protein MPSEU_000752500 [Mayamaea pseudoterrestris]
MTTKPKQQATQLSPPARLHGYGAINVTNQLDDSVPSIHSQQPEIDFESPRKIPLLTMAVASVAAILLVLLAAAATTSNQAAASSSILRSPRNAAILNDGRHHVSEDTWTPLYYKQQTVNHLDKHDKRTYSQKYFEDDSHFQGPGSPIFVVLGGEDPLTNLIVPFVYVNMAKEYGAATIGIEHRYFGDSYPVKHYTSKDLRALLTPRQAIEDFIQLIQWYRLSKGCSLDKNSPKYCPVITVAGSYPGFLSALMRLNYPDIVDIGYASSAPLTLYGQHADPYAYFDYVSHVADEAVPGCKDAVRTAVYALHDYLHKEQASKKTISDYAKEFSICKNGVPKYIYENEDPIHMFWTEVNAIIVSHFAEANMGYYPPGPDTELEQACRIFLHNDTMQTKIGNFLTMRSDWDKTGCFDMHSELPAGNHNATISASDWSGMGDGETALMWEFLSCQLLPPLSQGPSSMFYPRAWTLEWMTQKCQARFDYTPSLQALEEEFQFDDLSNVKHLLFVNGIRDAWSLMSITVPPPDSEIVVVNVAQGAHCKDFYGPGLLDTPDMVQAHAKIDQTIGIWLKEIAADRKAIS